MVFLYLFKLVLILLFRITHSLMCEKKDCFKPRRSMPHIYAWFPFQHQLTTFCLANTSPIFVHSLPDRLPTTATVSRM